jgi:hypothetical protein
VEAHGVRKWKEIQEGSVVLKDRTAVCVCVLCVVCNRNATDREMAELSVLSRFIRCRFCLATAVALLPWSSFAVRLGTYSYSSILKAVGGRWIARKSGVITQRN